MHHDESKRTVPFLGFLLFVAGSVLLLSQLFSSSAAGGPLPVFQLPTPDANGKVTICHATGLAGTDHFVTITIDFSGLNGHFDNNGTPLAGHEEDHFGPCEVSEETPTATNTAVATSTNTAVATSTNTAVATSTSTAEATATATEGAAGLVVPTDTPVATETAVAGVAVVPTNTPAPVVTVVSGVQGGAEQAVAGVSRLPTTGSGNSGGFNWTMALGIGLIAVGGGLASSRVLLRR